MDHRTRLPRPAPIAAPSRVPRGQTSGKGVPAWLRSWQMIEATNPTYTSLAWLFPFNFRICCSCVAGVVVVEQAPARPLGSRCAVGGSRQGLARGDHGANIARQGFEIAALVGERAGPGLHPAVTWNPLG